jgi:hypothetical protein
MINFQQICNGGHKFNWFNGKINKHGHSSIHYTSGSNNYL